MTYFSFKNKITPAPILTLYTDNNASTIPNTFNTNTVWYVTSFLLKSTLSVIATVHKTVKSK